MYLRVHILHIMDNLRWLFHRVEKKRRILDSCLLSAISISLDSSNNGNIFNSIQFDLELQKIISCFSNGLEWCTWLQSQLRDGILRLNIVYLSAHECIVSPSCVNRWKSFCKNRCKLHAIMFILIIRKKSTHRNQLFGNF